EPETLVDFREVSGGLRFEGCVERPPEPSMVWPDQTLEEVPQVARREPECAGADDRRDPLGGRAYECAATMLARNGSFNESSILTIFRHIPIDYVGGHRRS